MSERESPWAIPYWDTLPPLRLGAIIAENMRRHRAEIAARNRCPYYHHNGFYCCRPKDHPGDHE